MQLLKMSGPQCLLYSAAMILEEKPEELIGEIGHTGLERVFNFPEPACFRSHHMQEILDCFMGRGYGLMLVEFKPVMAPNLEAIPISSYPQTYSDRFYEVINGKEAIMIGEIKGRPHAWAWDGEKCYDPNGSIRNLDDYKIKEAWVKVKLI